MINFDESITVFLAAVGLAYLIGSIPFGVIVVRILGQGDLRKVGSGNIGATNVVRTVGTAAGIITLVLDAAKGAIAFLTASVVFDSHLSLFIALAAFIGHLHPVWLRFQGGKGVATYLGITIAVSVPTGLLACLVWLLVFAVVRISSAASITTVIATPVLIYFFDDVSTASLAAVMSIWVAIRHHQNISRLLNGTEPRIKFRRDH